MQYRKKLLEEFLLKLDSELAFHVRIQDPDTYQKAVQVAKKMETLLKIKTMDNINAELAALEAKNPSSEINIELLAEELARRISFNQRFRTNHFRNDNPGPSNNRQNYQQQNFEMPQVICNYCNREGHNHQECFQRLRDIDEFSDPNQDFPVAMIETRQKPRTEKNNEARKLKLQIEALKIQNEVLKNTDIANIDRKRKPDVKALSLETDSPNGTE